MTLLSLITRLRPRPTKSSRPAVVANITMREWADLPVYHPLRPN